MRRRKWMLLLVGACIVIGLILTLIRPSVLALREQRTGHLLWLASPDDGIFSLQWMHSVELEQWRETFQIKENGNLHLLETRFKAWGAGVPNNDGDEFYIEDDWFVMKKFKREFPSLPVNVSCDVDYKLMYDDNVFHLCDWVKDDTGIVIRQENVALWTYLTFLVQKEGKHGGKGN